MGRTNVQEARPGTSEFRRLCAGAQLATAGELCAIAVDLVSAGYSGLELHPHHLSSLGDRVFRERALATFTDAGIEPACVYVGVPSDEASSALVRARCTMAAAVGATRVFLVPPSRSGAQLHETAALVRGICVHAGELGLTVNVHNHAGTSVTTVGEALRLLELVDRQEARICLDVAHLALYEEDLAAAIRELAPAAGYVHLKDLEGWARDELAHLDGSTLEGVVPLTPAYTDLGAGALDLAAALTALEQAGEIWIGLEMETLRAPTVLEQCRANAAAFRSLRSSVLGAARS